MKKKMFQVNGVLVENGVRLLTRNVRRPTRVVVSFILRSSSAVPVSQILRTICGTNAKKIWNFYILRI